MPTLSTGDTSAYTEGVSPLIKLWVAVCVGHHYFSGESTSLGPIYSRDLYSYGVLRTIVLVPETPLANKLFVNTRCQPWRPAAWPVPSPVA
jgi:hypothetical protein